MKLIFNKDEEDNIVVQMAIGTIVENFEYVSMVKELLKNNSFEETQFADSITADERERINNMLMQINKVINEDDD